MKQKAIKSKRSFLQTSQHLATMQGYWIFPTLLVASLSLFLRVHYVLASLSLLVVLLKLVSFKQGRIIYISLLVALLYLPTIYVQIEQQKPIKHPEIGSIQKAVFQIDPNTIRSDGVFVTAVGRNQTTKQKTQLSYQYKTSLEKKQGIAIETFYELAATVVYTNARPRRNLAGFDYRQYLADQTIFEVATIEEVTGLKKSTSLSVWQTIGNYRAQLLKWVRVAFLPVTASFIKSLFLGEKDAVFKEQQNDLQTVGLLYFFSISGLHIYFFSQFLRYILLRLGCLLEIEFWLELFFLFGFMGITGFSTSVGRSAFYRMLSITNRRFVLHFSQLDCWSFSLLICLLVKPYVLFSAAGQLSFGLSFCLLYILPAVQKFNSQWQKNMLLSFSLSLFSLPLIAIHFHQINLLSVPLGLLLLPLFTHVIFPGLLMAVALTGFGLIGQNSWLLQGVEICFTKFQEIIHWLAYLPLFVIRTGSIFPLCIVLLLSLSLLALIKLETDWRQAFLYLSVLIVILSSQKFFDPFGMIAVVDVGQGDSIFIQTPFRRETVLIDTGGRLNFDTASWQAFSQSSSNAAKTLIPFLKSRGVKNIDKVFITHSDEDHFGDLLEVSQLFPIKKLYFPTGNQNYRPFKEQLDQIEQQGNEILPILAPKKLEIVGLTNFFLLYPVEPVKGENDDSLVIWLEVAGTRFLLTGDLEASGEAKLLAMYPNLATDVLKAGHHGSKHSTSEKFLEQITPTTILISCGLDNRYGHPHSEFIETSQKTGSQLHRTDLEGMLYYQWNYFGQKMRPIQTIQKE